MVEIFSYKLFNKYISEFIPEINWIDMFNDQYNDDGEDRPFKGYSCFIEFQPRIGITTTQNIRQDGQLLVNFHLTMPRSDNYTYKKKNVNRTLSLFSLATKFNQYLNALDSSVYPKESTYKDNLLIESTNVYGLGRGHLTNFQSTYNEKFQIIQLTYLFEYSDASAYRDITFLSGWTYDLEIGTQDTVGSFSDDFGTSYDVRNEINYIWIERILVSGSTMTITGHSFSEGVPMDLEYGVIASDTQLPTYQTSNTFTGLTPGDYWVYIRDQRGVGFQFTSNPVKIT